MGNVNKTALTKYTVKKVKGISDKRLTEIAEKTAVSFENDVAMNRIFPEKPMLIRFLKAQITYQLKTGIVYLCFDQAHSCTGIAMWNDFTHKSSTHFFSLVKFLTKIPLSSFRKMMNASKATTKYHYKKPHCYLEIIASFSKGAGSALMNAAIHDFGSNTLYLENSMPENNYNFYHKFGFEKIKNIKVEGHEVMLMLKK